MVQVSLYVILCIYEKENSYGYFVIELASAVLWVENIRQISFKDSMYDMNKEQELDGFRQNG